ncbi:MAG: hypothetical protein B7Y90_13870 [Alphaproteobacteria bacterium 32-64-14]|nr:MAG: hypothetical protein B7Y90_13870 [Alphaproteobacteria bacterium 32-64-14]
MSTNPEMTFEDVVNVLIHSAVEPSYDNLLAAMQDYPQFSSELANLFSVWAAQVDDPSLTEDKSDNDRAVAMGLSYALNLLHRVEGDHASEPKPDPNVRLSMLAKFAGLSEEELALRVGVDETFIYKLDQRRIQPADEIPELLLLYICAAVAKPQPYVLGVLRGPAIATSRAALQKSAGKPVVKTETFAEAIRASTLGEAEKTRWLSLVQPPGSQEKE